ncbi:tyrosine-type recombinase/integrase [Streptomyces sp. NPDC002611]
MARRNANGDGTIYQRKDGRWEAAVYVFTTSGVKKRVRVYGATRAEVAKKLTETKAKNDQGILTADKNWILSDYLDYWLTEVIKPNRRATTYDLYEVNIRLHLKPHLGDVSLRRLTVPVLQRFFNQRLVDGLSVRKVQILREVLSSALTRAMREELVTRNVASLIELPSQQREVIRPWSLDELRRFLDVARTHEWFPAFLLVGVYGLRRGEAIGVRWCDVDFTGGELHIKQQVFRAGGTLHQGPLKTQAGQRDLPLLAEVAETLVRHRGAVGSVEHDTLVLTAASGRPIEPMNFSRAFQNLLAKHGIRRIKLHHVRHTVATLLKDLGVPARDIQLILGHSHVNVTQQIYQHDSMETRREALERMEEAFHATNTGRALQAAAVNDAERCRQDSRQTGSLATQISIAQATESTPTTEVTAGGVLHNFFGDLTGNRTPIARMRNQNRSDFNSVAERATEVDAAYRVRRRRWLIGAVAVSVAVKDSTGEGVELAA